MLRSNPHLGRLVLADNGIGQEGAAALGEALKVNTELQVGASCLVVIIPLAS